MIYDEYIITLSAQTHGTIIELDRPPIKNLVLYTSSIGTILDRGFMDEYSTINNIKEMFCRDFSGDEFVKTLQTLVETPSSSPPSSNNANIYDGVTMDKLFTTSEVSNATS